MIFVSTFSLPLWATCFADAAQRAAARNLEVVAHVILGLPGEGPAEMAATARFVAGLPVQGVKIHLLYVIKGSALERLYASGAYQPLTEGDFVRYAADFLEILPPTMVIHRVTGDPHAEELAAPLWCLDKARVLSLIREDIELITVLHSVPLSVFIDPGQLEHVLINLATNARDAMPGGGTLIIETGLTMLNEHFQQKHGAGEIDGGHFKLRIRDWRLKNDYLGCVQTGVVFRFCFHKE